MCLLAACGPRKMYNPAFGYRIVFDGLPAELREPDGDLIPEAMQGFVYVAMQRVAPILETVQGSLPLRGWQPAGSSVDYWEWVGQWNTDFGPTPESILAALPSGLDPARCRERVVHARYWTESGADAPARGLLYVEFRVWARAGPETEEQRIKAPDRIEALVSDVIDVLRRG